MEVGEEKYFWESLPQSEGVERVSVRYERSEGEDFERSEGIIIIDLTVSNFL